MAQIADMSESGPRADGSGPERGGRDAPVRTRLTNTVLPPSKTTNERELVIG